MIFFTCVVSSYSQNNQAVSEKYIFPLEGQVNVSKIKTDWKFEIQNLESPVEGNETYRGWLLELKKEISNRFPRKETLSNLRQIKGLSIDTPVVKQNFEGNVFTTSVPNDNTLAVSNDGTLLSAINVSLNIYESQTGTLKKSLSLPAFSSSLTSISPRQYDPKLIYDFKTDRFIIVFLAGASSDTSTHIVVGFSKTSDPMGDWNLYALPGNPIVNDTSWTDYPAIALNDDELFITGNLLKYGGAWQTSFKQSVIWQVNKFDGYNGTLLQTRLWKNIKFAGTPVRNIHPVQGGDHYYGPGLYFLSNKNFAIQSDTIFLIHINGNLSSSNPQLTVNMIKADKTYGAPPVARQPNNHTLETNDARVLGAFYQYTHIQFVANTIDTSNGFAAVYHGFITDLNSTPKVHGNILTDTILDFGYPNITYIGEYQYDHKSLITFNHTGKTVFPGFSGIYSEGFDNYSPRINIKKGNSFINILSGFYERWGDYSGTQRKYNEPGVVWVSGTFGKNHNFYPLHGTWIAELKCPIGGFIGNSPHDFNPSIELPKHGITEFSASITPNPVQNDLSEVNLLLPNTTHIKVSIFDLNGKLVFNLYDGIILEGRNKISFSTMPLSNGIYVISLTENKQRIYNQKLVVYKSL